jgi:putative transposase
MPNSNSEIYLHFVWTTYRRHELITAEVERPLYACILTECRSMGCEALAIGGMPDHVHLAVRMATRVSPASLMQWVKGVSSTATREHVVQPGDLFGWQDGYGVFSFSRSHLPKVISYIRNQKHHHGGGKLWTVWEPSSDGGHFAGDPSASSPSGGRP